MENLNSNKKNKPNALYRFATNAGRWVFLCFSALLLLTGAFSIAYIDDILSQRVLFKWGPDLRVLPGLLIVALLFFLIKLSAMRFKTAFENILLFAVLFWILISGFIIVFFGKTVPAADAMTVYSMAESAASGNLSFIAGSESYLSYYPQQIGMVTAFILPIKLWNMLNTGLPAYHFLKLLYVFIAAMTVLIQYYTLKRLFKGNSAENLICCIYLFLAGANLPFILYTSFLYGEIPSTFTISAAVYFLASLIRLEDSKTTGKKEIGKTCIYAAMIVLFSALSVFLRKNSLIFVIALSIVLFFELIRSKRLAYLLVLLLAVISSLFIQSAVLSIYESATGRKVLSGVTATSYIAMGMQEADRGYGWYNGFNFNTYQDANFDTNLANEISRKSIEERINVFKENPSYAAEFYLQKYASQWSDGTYASRQATWAQFSGRAQFMDSLYTGDFGKFFIIYCDIHQLIIFIGTFISLLLSVIRKGSSKDYRFFLQLGILYVFGGFLFHMLWEANSRYIFPYSIFLVPYAAYGYAIIISKIGKKSSLKNLNP